MSKTEYENRLMLIALRAIDYLRTSKLELVKEDENRILLPLRGQFETSEIVPGKEKDAGL